MKPRCLCLAALLVWGIFPLTVYAEPQAFDPFFVFRPVKDRVATAPECLSFHGDDPEGDEPSCKVLGWYDAAHVVQLKQGRLFKVQALTGKQAPFTDAAWLVANDHVGSGPSAVPQKKGGKDNPTSPNGNWTVAVRSGNLFVIDKATKTERQLTKDGDGSTILNGKTDWVYQEELFGRGNYQAFWWSPDSNHLAFLRVDDTDVPKFTILDNTQRMQTPEVTRYPKSGQPNPIVKLGIAKIADGSIAWADFPNYPKDYLISRVGWLPDSKAAYVYAQDRIQTWLDVCAVACEGGKAQRLYRDSTLAWIEDLGALRFLKDGSFLVFSVRSGYKHLYHRAPDGNLKAQITSGPWDVRKIDKIDEDAGVIYFTASTEDFLGSQAYRVNLDGTRIEKITTGDGTHDILFSPDGQYFVDTFSSRHGPDEIQLLRADGRFIRTIDQAPADPQEKQGKTGKHEFVQIKTLDGFMLNATVTFPPNIDPSKKYPVWFMTYGGPHAPQIKSASKTASPADKNVAAAGYIVMHSDPRSASGKGAVAAWTCYKQLGVQETKDIEAALQWLLDTYPFADAKRIGMSGTSYGGYITAYCMTHSKMFAAGVAGAPVTDWRNYDSIYTERYMDTPQNNPEGYKVSSVVAAAGKLHGRLLLVHGMRDDNVHVQNSVELMDALQKANKQFEVMFYPHARHGGFGAHYQQLQLDFMKRVLQPGT
jgi:dipeptidyl-peptidase-4